MEVPARKSSGAIGEFGSFGKGSVFSEVKTEDERNRVAYFCVTLGEAEPAQLAGRSTCG